MPRVLSESDFADFRERLCEAATRLFAAKGLDGVTMRELASELGVSAMTPYRYFRDKNDILAAVCARAFDRLAETLEKTAPGSAPARLQAAGEAYVRFALEESSSYRLMFDLAQPGEDDHPDLVRVMARTRAALSKPMRALVAEGLLAGDPELIAHVFWAALHGAVTLQLAGKLTPQYGLDKIVPEAILALGEGFRPKT